MSEPPTNPESSPIPDARPAPPRHILILGLGNDLLTDDAIGLRITAEARRWLSDSDYITIRQTTEMGLALLDEITGFDELVIVDAIQTGGVAPGFVHEIQGTSLSRVPLVSPHFVGIGELLALARELHLKVPGKVRIFAVEVEDPFTVGTHMSPFLETALPNLVERLVTSVRPPP